MLCGFLRILSGLYVEFVGARYSWWVCDFNGALQIASLWGCVTEKFKGVWCKVSWCSVLSWFYVFLSEMTPILENGTISSPCWYWLQLWLRWICPNCSIVVLINSYLAAIARCNRGVKLLWFLCCTCGTFYRITSWAVIFLVGICSYILYNSSISW